MDPSIIPLPNVDPERLLGAVRFELRGKLASGQHERCPCCSQNVQVYSRRINAGMIRALMALGKAKGAMSAKALANAAGARDYPFLAHWKLAEKGKLGWVITPYGRGFLDGTRSVISHLVVFDNRVIGNYGKSITLPEFVEEFDLAELLDADNVALIGRKEAVAA